MQTNACVRNMQLITVLFASFQPICPSRFNQRDAYETSYNESHRPFSQHERRAAAHWENKDQRERQWLRDPITSKKLQMRVPIPPSAVTKSMILKD